MSTDQRPEDRSRARSTPSRPTVWAGLAIWAGLVAAAMLWPRFWPIPAESHVDAPPYFGDWAVGDLSDLAVPVALGIGIVVAWPVLTRRLATASIPIVSGLASVTWAVTLAASAGWERVWEPMDHRLGYLGVAETLDPDTFVSTFVDRVERYPIHVKGHPPGLPLLFHWLGEAGLMGPQRATIAVLAMWGIGIAAVLGSVALLGGRRAVVAASGPVAFLPGVVWAATSADALMAGSMACAVFAIVVAAVRRDRWSDVAALVGGALGAFAVHLSYGLAPLAVIALLVLIATRRVRPAIPAAIGGAVVVGWFVQQGFWWFDGLEATQVFYHEGIAQFRPYSYFTFAGNPGNLAIAVGPITVVGLAAIASAAWVRRRADAEVSDPSDWYWWMLPLGALIAVTAADLSGLSKAEVERIWLPFMPWLAVAAAAVTGRGQRWWLALSIVTAVILQGALVTPW